jgi:hypothetical protein
MCAGGSPFMPPRSASRLRRPPVSELLALPEPLRSPGSMSVTPVWRPHQRAAAGVGTIGCAVRGWLDGGTHQFADSWTTRCDLLNHACAGLRCSRRGWSRCRPSCRPRMPLYGERSVPMLPSPPTSLFSSSALCTCSVGRCISLRHGTG